MRGIVTTVAAACLAIIASQPAVATDIKAARVWAGPEYTRVVFDLSDNGRYKVSPGDKPGDMIIELPGGSLAGGFRAPGAQGLFKGLDVPGKGARVVAHFDPTARPKSFLVKPAGDYGYRLVLDLYPGDPALAKVGQKNAGTSDDDDSDDDASSAVAVRDAPPARTTASGKRGRATASSAPVASMPASERKVVVAVDAGHGGEDSGARGATGLLEKDVTLNVARELAAQINAQPGMQAVLTRNGDYFIPLKRRYQIAREHNADLFVSIHADAFKNSDARGSSVWVLSPRGKTSEAARWLADRENRADLVGGVSLDDKDDTLAAVLLDLQQGYAMQASESIANNVLKAIGQLGPTHRGYVERANFVVLRSPDVPSILVETAFITNPSEETKLRSSAHRQSLATAVLGGIRNYFANTPPPGTWFAAQAARRNGNNLVAVAKRAEPVVETASQIQASPVVGAATAASKAANSAARRTAKAVNIARADDNVRDLHRVARGETLRGIAQQYGVSVGSLRQVNQIPDSGVRAGTVLAIPSS
ncbi:N-acetylmuramoyl-L-alanine amidase [Pinirhizobacter sp.]|jgi:N-acetylmuramoyl-L-alanine amidase|uniref:N-acetylmuramoyl-L-alanine amidase n=1 Tax=Pinirhizobacter sp. TaxID=2950432 RepID=UPI002F40BC75